MDLTVLQRSIAKRKATIKVELLLQDQYGVFFCCFVFLCVCYIAMILRFTTRTLKHGR